MFHSFGVVKQIVGLGLEFRKQALGFVRLGLQVRFKAL